jgi:hypothetical protein
MAEILDEKRTKWVVLSLEKNELGFARNADEDSIDITPNIAEATRYYFPEARDLIEDMKQIYPDSEWWALPDREKGAII